MPIDLMTLDVRTGEHRAILSGLSPEDAFIPQAWSPDSQVVLLLSEDRTALHAVNVDGSGFGEVAGSTLSAPKSNYRGVRWSLDGGYLFFHRDPPLPRGEIVTTMETEIWAAVVRLPEESDADAAVAGPSASRRTLAGIPAALRALTVVDCSHLTLGILNASWQLSTPAGVPSHSRSCPSTSSGRAEGVPLSAHSLPRT